MGAHWPSRWLYYLRGIDLMQTLTNRTATRSRTAVAIFAATLLVGGTATEASARSGHHRHHQRHHHHHHLSAKTAPTGWRDASASIFTTSGLGRLFSGMASYYGSESGSR